MTKAVDTRYTQDRELSWLRFNERVPKGTEITVMLALDNSGILHVMAEELCRHSKLETTFDLSNQMTEDERITAVRRTAETTVE